MRTAWRALTPRGRGLLAAGAVLVLGAVAFGQRDLLRVGVLVLALPALSLALVARTRFRLACARGVAPSRVAVTEPATVTLALENVSRLPSGLMLLEDTLPWELGARPRFVLDRIEPQGHRDVTYQIATTRRGRYQVGPLALRLVDPFGLCALTRSFHSRDLLLVTPVVHRLPTVPLGGDWAGQGEHRARAMAASGEDDVVPRDYHVGDDLRRVHWRATARTGDLMVRREEQPWRARATVLLDNRAAAHRGYAESSSLEPALSAAASIGVHLVHQGWSTRFLDADAVPLVADAGVGTDVEGLLLDALAVLGPSPSQRLAVGDPATRRQAADGLVVAILGALSLDEAGALARVRPAGGTGLALVLDVAAWDPSTRVERPATGQPATERPATGRSTAGAPSSAAAAPAALLQQAGWRVAVLGPRDALPEVWPRLARGVGPVAAGPLGSADRPVAAGPLGSADGPGTAGRGPDVPAAARPR